MRKTLQKITFMDLPEFCACEAVSQDIQGIVLGEKNVPLVGANVSIKEINRCVTVTIKVTFREFSDTIQ